MTQILATMEGRVLLMECLALTVVALTDMKGNFVKLMLLVRFFGFDNITIVTRCMRFKVFMTHTEHLSISNDVCFLCIGLLLDQ